MIALVTVLKDVLAKVRWMVSRNSPPHGGHLLGFAVAADVSADDIAIVEAANVTTVVDDDPDIALARLIAGARDCEGEGELLSGLTPAQIMQRMLDQ
jgi:hypothetical protein